MKIQKCQGALTDGEWIAQCDKRFSDRLKEIAEQIYTKEHTHLLKLTGPTCSGKTTAANMLRKYFEALGCQLHIVSIDDFYYNRDVLLSSFKKKGTAEIDYDSPKTIEWDALRSFTRDIMENDKSQCPIFNFKEGKRTGYRTYECGENDVFLFEGIQVLYPEANEIFDACGEKVVGIYIAPQTSLYVKDQEVDPNELRLLRRLVRDENFRGMTSERTFFLWESVRANEDTHIFPYIDACEYRIDSTMPYELGVLKPFLERALKDLSSESPYYLHAKEILSLLEPVTKISSHWIQEGSLYKEFV